MEEESSCRPSRALQLTRLSWVSSSYLPPLGLGSKEQPRRWTRWGMLTKLWSTSFWFALDFVGFYIYEYVNYANLRSWLFCWVLREMLLVQKITLVWLDLTRNKNYYSDFFPSDSFYEIQLEYKQKGWGDVVNTFVGGPLSLVPTATTTRVQLSERRVSKLNAYIPPKSRLYLPRSGREYCQRSGQQITRQVAVGRPSWPCQGCARARCGLDFGRPLK